MGMGMGMATGLGHGGGGGGGTGGGAGSLLNPSYLQGKGRGIPIIPSGAGVQLQVTKVPRCCSCSYIQ